MDIVVQPLLVDRIRIQLYSPVLMRLNAEDENATLGGLTKKMATENAERYYETSPEEFSDKTRYKGRPVYWFHEDKYKRERATRVSIQPYHSFSVWISGNPTVFQKQAYTQEGHIDGFKNALETRHKNNFLHTDICDLPPRTMELDNLYHLPDIWRIAESLSQDFLGYGPTGYDYPHIYKNPTIDTLEINQDILLSGDSVSAQTELVTFLQSPEGRDYLQQTGIRKARYVEDYTYPGTRIELDYGKNGKFKVYPKTHHAIRVEIELHGNQHIKKHYKSKSLDLLEKARDEIARPLLQKVNIPRLLQETPTPRDITPTLFERFIDDPQTLHIAKKLYERKYLLKKEIPQRFLKGKNKLFQAQNHEGTWHYTLREEG
ncbi:MAG: hypothetical protein QCI38_03180 [Candidatus Thermoplasmatota archaeon]|nr:hypothetical protein [Candidatus Thermoplasmatota archaeon]